MQSYFINFILKLNKKYFFKKPHPFNTSKKGVLNLNYSDFEYSHAKDLLAMYSEFIDLKEFKNKSILEVGCGAWGKSVYIAEKYDSNVTWLDINDNFLSQARIKSKEHNVDNKAEFINVSALDTKFDDNMFDIIIMSDVIEHIPNTELLFDEMFRVLKKGWIILFDFASYYHYFWHHLWDTIQIPWIHIFFTDKFLIKLYKESVKWLVDWDSRIKLRIWNNNWKEVFDYLNNITRKDFEKIIWNFLSKSNTQSHNIKYFMLKNFNFLSKIPLLREIFIRHIIWYIKK